MRRRSKPRLHRPTPIRVRAVGPDLVRIVILAALGTLVGAWALWDHLHRKPEPMIVFVFDAGAPAEDLPPDAGLLPAPDLEWLDGGR
jgi:hypothetical protein